MTTHTPAITADQLLHRPADGFRYELVRGELRRMNPAGGEHGGVGMQLAWRLAEHVARRGLGRTFLAETGFLLATSPDTVRAPDAAYVSHSRLGGRAPDVGFLRCAPDLVVEVISPSDRPAEVDEKAADWLAAGARMVLLVDPRARTIRVLRSGGEELQLGEGDLLDGGEVVPGWSVPVADIFA